jgi:hypothetical protein
MYVHRAFLFICSAMLLLLGFALGSRAIADRFAPGTAPPEDDAYYRSHEQPLFQKFAGLGSRAGNRLTINTTTGSSLIYDSMPAGCSGLVNAPCLIYQLDDYDPAQDMVTVIHAEVEWHEVILIDRKSGAQIPLGATPVVSAGGQYWAAVTQDDMNGENRIEVVARTDHAIKLDAKFEDQRCAFEEWRSATSFAVICQDLVERSDGRLPSEERLVSRDVSGKWAVSVTDRSLPDDALEQAERGSP